MRTRVSTRRRIAVLQCLQSGRLSSASKKNPASQLGVTYIPQARHHHAKESMITQHKADVVPDWRAGRSIFHVVSLTWILPECLVHATVSTRRMRFHSCSVALYTCRGTQIFHPMRRLEMPYGNGSTDRKTFSSTRSPSRCAFVCGWAVHTDQPAMHSIVRFELLR